MGVPEFVVGFSREEPSLTGVARFPEPIATRGFHPGLLCPAPLGLPIQKTIGPRRGCLFGSGLGSPNGAGFNSPG